MCARSALVNSPSACPVQAGVRLDALQLELATARREQPSNGEMAAAAGLSEAEYAQVQWNANEARHLMEQFNLR
jgi:hypothetical protein